MATKITYETTCDVCKDKSVNGEKEYGTIGINISNLPLTPAQAVAMQSAHSAAETTEDGRYFGSFGRQGEVCSMKCARRMLIEFTNSLPRGANEL